MRIDIDPDEIATSRPLDLGIVGDARRCCGQLRARRPRVSAATAMPPGATGCAGAQARPRSRRRCSASAVPIHPLRLCKEVRDFIDRDAILVVDGQEILNFGRQTIPTFAPPTA